MKQTTTKSRIKWKKETTKIIYWSEIFVQIVQRFSTIANVFYSLLLLSIHVNRIVCDTILCKWSNENWVMSRSTQRMELYHSLLIRMCSLCSYDLCAGNCYSIDSMLILRFSLSLPLFIHSHSDIYFRRVFVRKRICCMRTIFRGA